VNVTDTLVRSAGKLADKVAVYHGETPYLTWRALEQRVQRLAAALRQLAVSQGDCVGLAMGNCPQFIEILYACWLLEHSGARVCFVTTDLDATLRQAPSASAQAVDLLLVGSDRLAALIEGADAGTLPATPQDDTLPAWLFYTSGTTGRPKGATLTHRNLLAMAAAYRDVDTIEAQDHLLHAAPMSHGSGLYIIPHIAAGAAQVVPLSGKFKEEELVGLVNHFGHCTIFAAPTMLQRLLLNAATDNLPGLKTMILGGGPLYVEDCITALKKFGPKLAQIYGQGETPMTITGMSKQQMYAAFERNDLDFLGSVGTPFSSIEVAVVDGNDKPVPTGDMGEIVVRGDTVMSGYWHNPDASADTLRGGWLHTGDVGCFDANRVLTLKDRSKDLIISGGTNIYPREVEECLLRHPAVQEACVLGLPDPQWGESVVAALVPTPGATVDTTDVDQFCIDHLARFKRPKTYLVVDELPKTATGKVLKAKVKALFPEG